VQDDAGGVGRVGAQLNGSPMPIVRVEMLAGRTAAQKQEMAAVLSTETARIAGCDLRDVQVIFHEVPGESWAAGGRMFDNGQPGPRP
jgi:4-oxalocrotonate tautomerase